ncbi:Uma2 family endonuclease [Methylotuvimicrobium sp. KM1]|uniref:Uma2 family endonuclease n=1 Tax=Methylotuvimicrobium sp. KM1 TaxID=3377707 RepID=UPI0038511F6A
MLAKQNDITISVEEYLAGELIAETKHELIDGHVYAMVGTSDNHDRIAGNIYTEFRNHLKNKPCEPFGSDMKVKVSDNYCYPDVIVDCSFDENQPYFTETPTIIVEVLSKITRRRDRTIKLTNYLALPSLQEYVMIEQDYVDIEVLRRNEHWFARHYFLGDEVTLESIGLTLSVEAFYDRVHNEDMLEFLIAKQAERRD